MKTLTVICFFSSIVSEVETPPPFANQFEFKSFLVIMIVKAINKKMSAGYFFW